ncbi:MAG: hypothetical protein WAX80_03450 [Minisyncoccia bacterium]
MNPEENPENPLKQIRTFQGDVAEALKKQQESLVSIQRREQLRRDSVGPSGVVIPLSEIAKRRREIFFLSVGSIVLLAIGGAGAWYTYNTFVNKSGTPTIDAPLNRFISASSEINLDLTDASRDNLNNVLFEAVGNVPRGELKHIILRKSVLTKSSVIETSELLEKLGSQAPSNLVRAFDPLFMFGAFGKSSEINNASTFIIIKLASFENAFAGMLLWEKDVAQDLGPLFATSQALEEAPPESIFTDITDRNKDIRALVLNGQPVLLYSFFDNNMLIITDDIETMRALVERLTREKLSR